MQSQPNPGTLARTASQTLETLMAMLRAELDGLNAEKSSLTGAITAAELSAAQAANVLNAQANGMRAAAIASIIGAAVNFVTTAVSAGMQAKGKLGAELKQNRLLQSQVGQYKTALKAKLPDPITGAAPVAAPAATPAVAAPAAAPAPTPAVATPKTGFADKHLNTDNDSRFQAPYDHAYEYSDVPPGGLEKALELAKLRLKDLKRDEQILLERLNFVTSRISDAGAAGSKAADSTGQFIQANIKVTEELPAEKLKEMVQALKDLLAQIKAQFEKVLDAQARAEEALQQLLKTVSPR